MWNHWTYLVLTTRVFFINFEGSQSFPEPSCPEPYHYVGKFTDCSRTRHPEVSCWGNNVLCGLRRPIGTIDARDPLVIQDFWSSPEGKHEPRRVACPSGYTFIGTSTDCEGDCRGHVTHCLSLVPLETLEVGDRVIEDLYVTEPAIHKKVGCAEGYRQLGSHTDCGYGKCEGEQAICAREVKL